LKYTSDAVFIPNGIRRYRNLPNGVPNVVSIDDFSSSVICQNPDFASKVENTVASAIQAATLSTVLIG
jgi:hypothetical protein